MNMNSRIPRGPPIVAVLPFILAEEDGDAALLAHGMRQDIYAELTRFRRMQVICLRQP